MMMTMMSSSVSCGVSDGHQWSQWSDPAVGLKYRLLRGHCCMPAAAAAGVSAALLLILHLLGNLLIKN